jgi:hypothetical protein
VSHVDHHHHADLFKRHLTHPNWIKIAMIVGTAAFWIAVIGLLRVVF